MSTITHPAIRSVFVSSSNAGSYTLTEAEQREALAEADALVSELERDRAKRSALAKDRSKAR